MLALLGFLRRQVGLRTDSASATGSLHAKLAELRAYVVRGVKLSISSASNNLKASADTERSGPGNSYTLAKSIQYGLGSGTVRVSFDIRADSNGISGCHGKIYINGVAVGTERSVMNSTEYITFTEDVTVKNGDFIQLYCDGKNGSYTNPYWCRNFRIYYDVVEMTGDTAVITD